MPLPPNGFDENRNPIPVIQPTDSRLGRVPNFDIRSRAFPVRAIRSVLAPTTPRSYTWNCSIVLDQGSIGSCVGNGVAHELTAKPVAILGVTETDALSIYHEAQQIDPWPGDSYEGTDVLSGVKVATRRGFYKEYRWAFGIEDLVMAVGYHGPAILGINWTNDMFRPDAAGFIHPSGGVAGGHCILNNGQKIVRAGLSLPSRPTLATLDSKKSFSRLHNSWSRSWGINGECFISFEDLSSLLQENGEACVPVIRSRP